MGDVWWTSASDIKVNRVVLHDKMLYGTAFLFITANKTVPHVHAVGQSCLFIQRNGYCFSTTILPSFEDKSILLFPDPNTV